MTLREDAERALRAGHNAEPGAPNPYNPDNPLLARVWMKGYQTMLTIRSASTPAMQQYLQSRLEK